MTDKEAFELHRDLALLLGSTLSIEELLDATQQVLKCQATIQACPETERAELETLLRELQASVVELRAIGVRINSLGPRVSPGLAIPLALFCALITEFFNDSTKG